MRTFKHVEEVKACLGQEVGVSEWITLTQEMINQFAQATGDLQWIHTDLTRAADGPFKTTIAHGFLTLSLIPQLFSKALELPPTRMAINYGLNKVRFTNPVPANAQVRGRFQLTELQPLSDLQTNKETGFQMTWQVTIEVQGQDKPACIAESIIRRYH
jgi:acyl dehydratase